MLQFVAEKWEKNASYLEEAVSSSFDYLEWSYLEVLRMTVDYVLNGKGQKAKAADSEDEEEWDAGAIREINDGSGQGTRLFTIPRKVYQPFASQYLMTFVMYSSLSGCDALGYIQDTLEKHEPGRQLPKQPGEEQVRAFMTLSRHMLSHMVQPFEHDAACG